MMTTLPPLILGSEESSTLQDHVKVELAQRQWSEGEDDEVMAEYILVMLANNKTSEQIANELKELIGEGSGQNSGGEGGVDDFVDWIWAERSRIASGSNIRVESLSSKTSDAKSREQWRPNEIKRRSVSPQARRDLPANRSNGEREHRREGNRWEAEQRRDYRSNEHRQRRESPSQRELFTPYRDGNVNGRMAADATTLAPIERRELLDVHRGSDVRPAAMDDPSLQAAQQRGPPSVRILGQGGNKLFQRSFEQTQHQHHHRNAQQHKIQHTILQQPPPNQSIFSRVLMPDPRAQEFVPSVQAPVQQSQSINLFSRLDPMMPDNLLPATATEDYPMNVHNSTFPKQPQETSLCRYSLGCTNPMCGYSHPSASAVAQSKKKGMEPMILKQDPCRFQEHCSNVECPYSHVSPAVTFVAAKVEKGLEAITKGSPTACHFQMDCKNAACTYAHYDPQSGQMVPSPALTHNAEQSDEALKGSDGRASEDVKPCRFGINCTRKDCHFSHPTERQLHISDRLARFKDDQMDGEMEVVIPVS
ncbi:hypothetical protein CBS101457_004167 [Exobasidium rhododendri]|nr:hypothetical protein CBS101457_004167 [Exobasidium rhododendri]